MWCKAVESYVNAIAAAIFCKAGDETLMDVTADAGLSFYMCRIIFVDQEVL